MGHELGVRGRSLRIGTKLSLIGYNIQTARQGRAGEAQRRQRRVGHIWEKVVMQSSGERPEAGQVGRQYLECRIGAEV